MILSLYYICFGLFCPQLWTITANNHNGFLREHAADELAPEKKLFQHQLRG